MVFFLLVVVACFSVYYCIDRIAAFSVNSFTDYRLSYDRWGSNGLDGAEIRGLRFGLENKRFVINAEKARFDLRTRQSLRQRQFIVDCEIEGVTFAVGDESKPSIPFSGNILTFPFRPDQKYEQIIFTVFLDTNTVKIMDFKAYSRDIRMEGDYILLRDKDDLSLDLKISFSPEIAVTFEDSIRENILSRDEDGWYSTIIDYKGNAVFLQTLYITSYKTRRYDVNMGIG